jgi:signal transduction histidine kinase
MNSLEWRLQLGLSLSLVLLMGVLWGLGNQAIGVLSEDFVTSRLEHDAESLLLALEPTSGKLRLRQDRITQIYKQPLSGHYYVIRTQQGGTLTSRSLWDQSLQIPLLPPGEIRRLRRVGPANQQLLLWVKGFQKKEHMITVAVAEDLTTIQQSRDRFMRYFAFMAIIGLIFLLLIQSLVIRHSFRRLERLREDIHRLERGKTDKLSEDVPSEILPLVKEFNHLLSLLSRRLERSRNALGNLAHALKGPLSLLRQYFEQTSTQESPLPTDQARGQVERVRLLVERELKRARMAGRGIQSQYFDPHQELPALIEVMQQLHQGRNLQIRYSLASDLVPFGDREDMLELLGNLLDNACKWANHRVICQLSASDAIEILVEDDGAGLSDLELDKLTQRGTRLDETVDGHGLGLAIAKDIVKLYAGVMGFSRSHSLGGLQVSISLPQWNLPGPEAGRFSV